jgi:hypothetical protein
MELNNNNEEIIRIKKTELTLKDVKFLSEQSGLPKISIINLFNKYFPPNDKTWNGELNKEQFFKLYTDLRPEPSHLLYDLTENIFNCFDRNHNGFISLEEFLTAFSITSIGGYFVYFCFWIFKLKNIVFNFTSDPVKKLEYLFDVYVHRSIFNYLNKK